MVNVRTKGQTGEREVAKILNGLVKEVRAELGLTPLPVEDELFQRNQNQSAVGGDDLTNPLGLSIEVKRQEALSINTWWNQCVLSSERFNGIPILIFRQNRKKWRVMMRGYIPVSVTKSVGPIRTEIDLDTFKSWFKVFCKDWYNSN